MPPQMALPAGEAAPLKARVLPPVKPPRIIVEHFDIGTYKVDQAHGYVEANCLHCGATIRGQRNVTSNFIQHMRRRHPEGYGRFAAASAHRAKRPRLSAAASSPAAPPKQALAAAAAAAASPAPAITQTPPAAVTTAPAPPIAVPAPPVYETPPRPVPRAARHAIHHPADPPAQPAAPASPPRPEMTLETALVSATYRAAVRTACDPAPALSQRTSSQVYIKREDLQVAGSPVFRAAYNYLAATPTSRAGLVAAGAAALPAAAAAQLHAKPCLAVVPVFTPPALLRKLAKYDAKYELVGDTDAESAAVAMAKAMELNRTYVDLTQPKLQPGCGDAAAGYATLALELLQQRQHVDRIFMAGDNSLLFSGVYAVLQRVGRGVKLIGVVHDPACDDAESPGSNSAGAEGSLQSLGEDWAVFADDVIRVGRSEMCAAVKAVFEDCDGCMLEPTGALSVAGALKYARVHKLAHERVVCVVDSPLRSFDRLQMVTARSWRADGSHCLLCVHRRSHGAGGSGVGNGLSALMRELSGTAGGRARVTSLRFSGKWPLLLGLACDATTTAGAHVANLTSLGYVATDVTGSDLTEDELWTWGDAEGQSLDGEAEGPGVEESSVRWAVFRVEVLENTNAVVNFLAVERTEAPLRKVSFSHDGGGTARLLVAARGTEWQLGNLESEMSGRVKAVRRMDSNVSGLRVLGCSSEARRSSNGDIAVEGEVPDLPMTNEQRADGVQTPADGVQNGGRRNGVSEQSTVPHATPQNDTAQNDAEQNNVGHDDSAQNDVIQHGETQQETVREDTAPNAAAQHEAAQHETAQHEVTQDEAAQHETAQHETAHQEAAHDAVAQHEAAQQEPTQHDSERDEGGQHDAVQHDTTPDNAAQQGGTQRDGSQHEGPMTVQEANEIVMAFAPSDGEVTVHGPGRDVEVGEGMEVDRQQVEGDEGRVEAEPHLHEHVQSVDEGGNGVVVQDGDVEMQTEGAVEDMAEEEDGDAQASAHVEDETTRRDGGVTEREEEDCAQEVAGGHAEEDGDIVEEPIMSAAAVVTAAAAAAAAEAVAAGEIAVDGSAR